jgi:hypothetical protein
MSPDGANGLNAPNGNIFRQILGFWQYFPPNQGFLEIISTKTLIFGNISHQ